MKTSEALLIVSKILVARKNHVGTLATTELFNKLTGIDKIKTLELFINLAERGYLSTSMVETSKGTLTQFISITKRTCDFIREHNANLQVQVDATQSELEIKTIEDATMIKENGLISDAVDFIASADMKQDEYEYELAKLDKLYLQAEEEGDYIKSERIAMEIQALQEQH